MSSFREIAPGIFVQDIEHAGSGTPSGRDVKRVSKMRFSAVDRAFVAGARELRQGSVGDQFGELIGTAIRVANTMGDARARIDHTLREVRSQLGEQLREAQRVVDRAQRRVR